VTLGRFNQLLPNEHRQNIEGQPVNQELNISMDVVRTMIVISETGSLSRAADRLNLSQPALSSQIKKIQGILGCELFKKTPNGSVPTEIGMLIIEQARRIIEANDTMLRIGGRTFRQEPIRLGISNHYVPELFKSLAIGLLQNVVIQGGNSNEIAKGLTEGYIDIGLFFASEVLADQMSSLILNEADERFDWVRSEKFVLSPGAPVPILSHPSNLTDALMIRALSKTGTPYRIAFNSADNQARSKAAEAGIGITVYPARYDYSPLIRAREYYLPELPSLKALLCARQGFDHGTDLLRAVSPQFFGSPSSPASASAVGKQHSSSGLMAAK
jgi:DNA-binding transcriptional LysR family regulator